jgi:hypothetical protein
VNLGYCGLDRSRSPLRGDEIRPCWDARPDAATVSSQGREDLVVLPADPVWPVAHGLFADADY